MQIATPSHSLNIAQKSRCSFNSLLTNNEFNRSNTSWVHSFNYQKLVVYTAHTLQFSVLKHAPHGDK